MARKKEQNIEVRGWKLEARNPNSPSPVPIPVPPASSSAQPPISVPPHRTLGRHHDHRHPGEPDHRRCHERAERLQTGPHLPGDQPTEPVDGRVQE